MPLVSLSDVSVSFGERKLLDSVNLTVSASSRIALVGPNGSGKSTLMRVMAGLAVPDSGAVVPERGTRISYVAQSGYESAPSARRVVQADATLREEAEGAFSRLSGLREEIAAIEERLGALSSGSVEADALLWKHHALREKLEASGYYAREEAIHRVLTGLGFRPDDFARPCPSFSAGWQMRIALARAILEAPDILLLDEPTNYLDIEARAWMEEFLAGFRGGLLLVSHDRYFLDVVVSAVAEIYLRRVTVFAGNYTQYEESRARELAATVARWRAQEEQIAHAEAFIRRFRSNASKARLVQSRITALEKIVRIEVPPVAKAIRFAFPPPPPCGRLALSAAGLSKSYGGHRVFDGIGLEVSRGDKLVVVGVNGAGKSTLLRIVSGREQPDAGSLRWGAGVVPAFYSQEQADAWSSDRQVLDEVEAAAPTSLLPELRTLLGSFLFRGEEVFKSVSVLSGGEKSRLALLMLLLRPANLLILDEPTNHLDIASKDVLQAALQAFAGTVIFVSHDRHFISHLATAVLELKDGGARHYPGDYDYYLRRAAQEQAAEAARDPAAAPLVARAATATQIERQEEKKLKSELRALEREEGLVLETLDALDAERGEIEASMARPDVYANGERMRELQNRHAGNRARHADAMDRWEQVESRLGSLKERIAGLRSGKAAR